MLGDIDARSEFHGLHQQLLGRNNVDDRGWYDYKRQPNGLHKATVQVSIIYIDLCNYVPFAYFFEDLCLYVEKYFYVYVKVYSLKSVFYCCRETFACFYVV